ILCAELQICATLGRVEIVSNQIYASNKKELARKLDIAHTTLLRYFKRDDYPELVEGKGWLIEQWQRYIKANIRYDKRRTGIDVDTRSTPNLRDEAYIKRQEVAAEREQFELDVKRGKYGLQSDMTERVMTNFGFFVRELDKLVKHQLPPILEGRTPQDISK